MSLYMTFILGTKEYVTFVALILQDIHHIRHSINLNYTFSLEWNDDFNGLLATINPKFWNTISTIN